MKLLSRVLPFLLLPCLVVLFFLPLFWPIPQLFVTPDSYLSDILHFHYPIKFLLWESLKTNSLPLWTDRIGTGFPLIGEGQIQALSLINLILFKFFPFITAFNLQFVIIFLGLTVGMYLVSREFGWSKLTGIFCAIIYGFSGLHIAIIPHINCLQALSYVPWIFWILLRMQKNPRSLLWLILPLLLSQQILQGHYQYVFMSYLFFGLYGYLAIWRGTQWDKTQMIKKIAFVLLLAFGLAAMQLLPSLEYFLKTGARSDLVPNAFGSFQLKHLIQFFSPYALGDVRSGTYSIAKYGVGFWETFAYIGTVPMLLALFSLTFVLKNTWIRTCWIIIAILFLFVFEKNSPIYFVFSLPPFSWFRVESRFLAFITLTLVLLSGFIFNWLEKKYSSTHVLILTIFFISIIEIFSFASSYHPMSPVQKIDKEPFLYTVTPKDSRMVAIPSSKNNWFDTMYSSGWKNTDTYLSLLGNGQPNYQLIYGLDNLLIYAGFLPQKQLRLMGAALDRSPPDKHNVATLSGLAINTLQLTNTGTILTPLTILNKEVLFIRQVTFKDPNIDPINLYTIPETKPRYYLTSSYKKVRLIDDYFLEAGKADALSSFDAFLTTDQTIAPNKNPGTLTISTDEPVKKSFSIQTETDTFFVSSLYLYPGWEAYLDGNKVIIEPANLGGMAVFIPKGTHTLTLQFQPKSLFLGLVITVLSLIAYLFLVIRSLSRISR
jgi:hypothetical protein